MRVCNAILAKFFDEHQIIVLMAKILTERTSLSGTVGPHNHAACDLKPSIEFRQIEVAVRGSAMKNCFINREKVWLL